MLLTGVYTSHPLLDNVKKHCTFGLQWLPLFNAKMDMMMIMMMMEEMVLMQGITNSFQILMSSGSVTDAFRLEIAIASPSFVSLLQC